MLLFRFLIFHAMIYSMAKCALLQALRLCTGRTAHRGSRGIALLFLDHDTRRGKGSASGPGRSIPPGKTRYPLYRRLGGPQGRSGQVLKMSPPHRELHTVNYLKCLRIRKYNLENKCE